MFWTIVIGVVTLDIITKAIAVATLVPRHTPRPVIGDLLRFTLTYNPGAAMGMHLGDYSRWVFSALACVALFVLYRLYRDTPPADRLRITAIAMIFAGAAGNLIDRIRSTEGVVDFIDVGLGAHRFWIFNVADMGVSVGAALLAWTLWRADVTANRADQLSSSQ